jgi:GNAT superfamily N-acetyltransferase
MERPDIITTDLVDRAMEEAVGQGLNQYNDEMTGVNDRRPLAVILRDPETGRVLGGATGRSSLGLLFLDLFHLPKELRGGGLGSEILRRFEAEGRRRGCRNAVLYTISFQAPGFYEKNGWRRFGEIPCAPPGTSRIFMTKDLTAEPDQIPLPLD